MITSTVTLHPFEGATLTAMCLSNTEELRQTPRRAVIVFPGGGYHMLSDREAEPIAAKFLAAGFAAFIFDYTLEEGAADFAPLCEAALAVKYVRENAAAFNVDPNYVFVCGFSAGGHCAASIGTLWKHPCVRAILGENVANEIARPTGMILCYPVITTGEFAHRGSADRVSGVKFGADPALLEQFSLEKQVDADTCPAFIWHTFNDNCVPVENSLMMASSMRKAGVPFELHIYPEGPHGLALGDESTACGRENYVNPHLQNWVELAARWVADFN